MFKYIVIALALQFSTHANSLDITNFQAESITTTSFTMTWDTLPDMDYNLAIHLHSDSSSPGSTTPTYTENVTSPYLVLLTSLGDSIQPSTIYDCYLNATNRSNPLDSKQASSVGITTVPGTPDKPILEEPVGAGADPTTQIRVTWYKPSGGTAIDSYVMEWMPSHNSSAARSAPFSYSNINSYPSFEYTLTDLSPGECYNVTIIAQIQATNQKGKPSEITVYRTVPPTPYNVNIQQHGAVSDSLQVTWEIFAVGHNYSKFNLASYKINVKNMETLNISVKHFDFLYDSSNEKILYHILSPASNYSATMQAISTGDDIAAATYSKTSNESAAIHVEDNRPTNVSVTNSTTTSIDIEWGYPADEPRYPIQGYVVTWCSTVDTNSTVVFNSTMMATLSGLISNTYYNITVQLKTALDVGIPSDPLIGATGPGPAVNIDASHSVIDLTTMIRIDWNKPNGGDAIEYYLVEWFLTNNNNLTNSTDVPHIEGKISYNYTFDGFIPGESYRMVVKAANNVTYSQKAEVTLSTGPEPVRNLNLTQNGSNPTRILDLHWSSPLYVSDRIEIAYYSLIKENATYKDVNSTVTETFLDVEPGTNYTVVVSAYSYNISSVEVTQRINSKPSEPQYNVTPARYQFELNWTQTSVHADGFLIQSDPSGVFPNITLDGSVKVYEIQDLLPYTNYTMKMHSWIIDIDGNTEFSKSTPRTYETSPGSCPTSIVPYPGNDEANATFAETVSGYSNTSIETCPKGTKNAGIPLGIRACSLKGEWQFPTFLTSCDNNIEELTMKDVTTEEQRVNVTSELVVLTSIPETLELSDIKHATDVLEDVVKADSLEMNTSAFVVETVGNLLAASVEELVESKIFTRLLSTLDNVTSKVKVSDGKQFQSTTSSTLAMFVLNISQAQSQNGIGFKIAKNKFINELGFSSDQFNVMNSKNEVNAVSSIYLPREVLNKTTDGKISFYSFVNNNIFSATSQLQVYSDPSTLTKFVINSQIVLTATVVNTAMMIENLTDLIEIRLELNSEEMFSINDTHCAFWDEKKQYWSTRGCEANVSTTSVQCQCDHLTNFASLLALSPAIRNEEILDILTYIGSSISIIALICTILLLLYLWNSRKLKLLILKATRVVMFNLSLALLFLNVFLLVSELYIVTSNNTSCLAVAIIIHFSLFSSLAWMMVEAIYLLIAITKPIYFRFTFPKKKFMLFSSLWGWGFPALFVTLVAAIKSEWYIDKDDMDICWIDSDMMVYLVIIPAALILICNLACYIVVVVTFVKHKQPGENSLENKRKREITFSLTLFVTFGITWMFGFLLFSSSVINLIFAYIFTILNSLQGVFLFFLFIYRNKNLRKTVSEELCLCKLCLSKRCGNDNPKKYKTTSLTKPQANNFKTGETSISAFVQT